MPPVWQLSVRAATAGSGLLGGVPGHPFPGFPATGELVPKCLLPPWEASPGNENSKEIDMHRSEHVFLPLASVLLALLGTGCQAQPVASREPGILGTGNAQPRIQITQNVTKPRQAAPSPTTLKTTFDVLLSELFRRSTGGTLPRRVAVGEFPCENAGHNGLSTVSRIIRDELEFALGRYRGGPQLVARSKLDDLLKEQELQSLDFLDPNAEMVPVTVKSVEAVIRGHYLVQYRPFQVRVKAELVMLNGGTVQAAGTTIAGGTLGVDGVLPGTPKKIVNETFLPASDNKQVQQNVASVGKISAAVKESFRLQVNAAGGRRDLAQGERLVLLIQPERDCHIAILDHLCDGSTVLLFPNAYCRDTFTRAGTQRPIPDPAMRFTLDVEPPFGADIVQVIACTSRQKLDALLRERQGIAGSPYAAVDRGVLTRGLTRGFGVTGKPGATPLPGQPGGNTDPGPVMWSEAQLTFYTYPKK